MAKVRHTLYDMICCLFGSLLFSLSVNMFSAPNDFVQGGLTGVGTILNFVDSRIPIGTTVFILNIPLFILGYVKMGKGFVTKTAIVTLLFSFLIDAGALFIPAYEGDRLLASIFCGVLSGTGLALVFLTGATTGGTDIIAKLVHNKIPSVSMGRVVLITDLVIVLASLLVYRKIENAMYAVIAIFVTSKLIDTVLYGTGHNKTVMIISNKAEEISKSIMHRVKRGVTSIPVTGGYSKKQHTLLICAARASEISSITRTVKLTDPLAFSIVLETGEIIGEGFK